jgi:hypothetical protein
LAENTLGNEKPQDMLTRGENWINGGELIHGFEQVPTVIPDAELRAQVSNYFYNVLAKHRNREANATDVSTEKVLGTEYLFVRQIMKIQKTLLTATAFYTVGETTYEEAPARLNYLKDVIENKGGHRLFYCDGVPIRREKDLQILYRLVWFGTPLPPRIDSACSCLICGLARSDQP